MSATGRLIASVGVRVAVVELSTGLRLPLIHPLSNPSDAAISRNESLLAIKNTGGNFAIVDIKTGQLVIQQSKRDDSEGAEVHFSPCDNYLVDGSWDGQICVRRVTDLRIEQALDFGNEMITTVSPSADGADWLFAHQPRTPDGENFAPPPYLTLWRWPLLKACATIDTGFDNLEGAALSPRGDLIALRGYRPSTGATELRLMNPRGEILASTATTARYSANPARWSPDSSLVGTSSASGFDIFSASNLALVASITAPDACDFVFLDDNANVLVEINKKTYIIPLELRNA